MEEKVGSDSFVVVTFKILLSGLSLFVFFFIFDLQMFVL